MKKYFLFIILFSGMSLHAQNNDTAQQGLQKRQLITGPAIVEKLEKIKDSAINNLTAPDENKIGEDVSRNMDSLLQLQKEQKAKQKKAAMIRIGIGLALLALLVYGLLRRKK